MNYYFAADLLRQAELQGYAVDLVSKGDRVTARWLNADFSGGFGKTTNEMRAVIAEECLEDVRVADAVILFAEPRGTAHIGGGRHFEAGYALGRGMRCIAIGHRENVFCCHADVEFHESWAEFLATLDDIETDDEQQEQP